MILLLILLLVLVAYLILKSNKTKKGIKEHYEYSRNTPQAVKQERNSYNGRKEEAASYEIEYEPEYKKNQTPIGKKDAYERSSIVFNGGEEYRAIFEIEIEYKDREGLSTTRQIKVKGFRVNDEESEAEIYGYCYLRDAGRTFYATRIKRCIDLDTGEIVKEVPSFLKAKYYSTPEGQLELWIDRRKCEIETLVYVGRLDTQLRKNEKEIIIDYVFRKEPELNITIDAIDDYLKKCGKISKAMFGRHLTKLATATDEEKIDFVETCEKIVGTKKAKTTEEENSIANIKRRLLGNTTKSKEE